MPIIQVKTLESKQVWSSPDGQRKIHALKLEYDGNIVTAKTYSNSIAAEGWEGTVELYEKEGRNGLESFVKQPPKEGGYSSGKPKSYQPKDENAIKAMWAIGKATEIAPAPAKSAPVADYMATIESYAQELFSMVERVKATPALDTPVTSAEIDEGIEDLDTGKQLTVEDIERVIPGAKRE